ncbi:MAG: FISUMP domain-containing protein, partial [Flavobacteriales bacterium]
MVTFSFNRIARVLAVCMAFAALAFIVSWKKDKDYTDTPPDNNTPSSIETVTIGSQQWMKKNLSVATYTDGTPIPQVTDPMEWMNLTTGAWCWYNNDSATYAATYGRLYNWYAVAGIYDEACWADPALCKQLAPIGWHVPSDAEWSMMINFLDPVADGGNTLPNIAGGMMKTIGT